MKIAVTGGTGFIGKRLVAELLAFGHEVRVLSRNRSARRILPRASVYIGDLGKDDPVLRDFLAEVDIVYHLAAELHQEAAMRSVNVDGMHRLMSATQGKVRRWVQLSSVGVYGRHVQGVITERAEFSPDNRYESSKAESDMSLAAWALKHGIDAVFIRPSNVYGPDMRNQSLFQLIAMIDRGMFAFVGPPGAIMNYIHVDNVVHALVLCLGHQPLVRNEAFIVSDYLAIEELVRVICRALGKRPPVLRLPERPIRVMAKVCERIPGIPITASRIDAMTNRAVYSSEKIIKRLGYQHKVTMEEGFRGLIESGHWR